MCSFAWYQAAKAALHCAWQDCKSAGVMALRFETQFNPDDYATAQQEACVAADDWVVLKVLLRMSPLHLLAWLPLMKHA